MNGILAVLQVVSFIALVFTVPTYLLIVGRIFSSLKAGYPALYADLGSPSLFMNNSIQNNNLFIKFLFSQNNFEALDPKLKSKIRAAKIFLILGIAFTLICVASMFLQMP